MNQAQIAICGLIKNILNNELFINHINTPCFSLIFKTTIRQYAEVNHLYQKTWNNINLSRIHHQFTIRAVDKMNQFKVPVDKEIWKVLHSEHIVPIVILQNQLLDLPCTEMCDVDTILQANKVVIMTKEEARVLDGRVNKLYRLDGQEVPGVGMRTTGTEEERLNAIGAELHGDYINNNLEDPDA